MDKKQIVRMSLLFTIFIIVIMLFNIWHKDNVSIKPQEFKNIVHNEVIDIDNDLPNINIKQKLKNKYIYNANRTEIRDAKRIITVNTDVYNLKIDSQGGDIISLNLTKYPQTLQQQDKGFVLLEESPQRYYIIQTGLLNEKIGPDSNIKGRALYSFKSNYMTMSKKKNTLNLDLHYNTHNNIKITKRFIFTRGSYLINIKYIVENNSLNEYVPNIYGRIKRNDENNQQKNKMFGGMRHYTGAAINTPNKKYQKLPLSNMLKTSFQTDVIGGWVAMVEHYFVSALIPPSNSRNFYRTDVFHDNVYGIGFVNTANSIAPGTTEVIEFKMYAGPEKADLLKNIAPGLELTIDYGIFWWLCQPIFYLLQTMFKLFSNWGLAIICTTIIIKALFYRLSASSYKSMGNMRKLQPKIEMLKQRYSDDRKKFSESMMQLYKKEKVNPLGGCLPILIQIPVFISLYYVLLEAVQLRQAPFVFWIKDLSAPDPYYILPIIMGISMFLQQRLNPSSYTDPIQAKVMMCLPVIFTFLFLKFPSGLVLYWIVNNILSILQQYMINKKIAKLTI